MSYLYCVSSVFLSEPPTPVNESLIFFDDAINRVLKISESLLNPDSKSLLLLAGANNAVNVKIHAPKSHFHCNILNFIIQPLCTVLLVLPHVMHGRELSTLVVLLSFLLCVTLECHFEALRKQDRVFYSHRFFFPLLEKVCFFCVVVSKKASVAQKANLVRKCLEKNKRCLNSA